MKSVKIDCPHCKQCFDYEIERKDLKENQREERSMGPDIEYSLSHPIQCPNCGANLEIEVFEYPESIFEATATEF